MNAIIFDFDGTIADSFNEVFTFLCKRAHRSPDDFSPEEIAAMHGLSLRQLALRVGNPSWKLIPLFFFGRMAMARRIPYTPVFAGMPELLAALHAADFKLYIISSNSKRNIQTFLSQQGMGGYFTQVYGSAGWFGKAQALRAALKEHNLEASKTVYIGDESRDIIAANLVSMPSVAVSWGFGSADKLLDFKPTILVRTVPELQKTLLDWGVNN